MNTKTLAHISTYLTAFDCEEKYVYVLFNNNTDGCIAIEDGCTIECTDHEIMPDIDYLNDEDYDLMYMDLVQAKHIINDFSDNLNEIGLLKITRYYQELLEDK